MQEKLTALIQKSTETLYPGFKNSFSLEHPDELSHGDYATNIALALSKPLKKNPLIIAVELVAEIKKNIDQNDELSKYISKVEAAAPGFINFYMTPLFFVEHIKEIKSKGETYGKNKSLLGKKVAVEYTDPNPFKQFHIGHLMTNIIGESLARLYEWNGVEVKRFCYQGDVGRHVALTIWGLRLMDSSFPTDDVPLSAKTKFLGEAYARAHAKVTDHPEFEAEIKILNKKIYERSDDEVNDIYDKGREWSLEHFEEIYEILGTKFDQYFFESVTAPLGKKIVLENVPQVFEESQGAIIFKGEHHEDEKGAPLHTRVFVTSDGLPTYDGKELGLAKLKHEAYNFDTSITVTGNEQKEYYKVFLKALSMIDHDTASKMDHVTHGMLRFASGKMSSRTGNVITGESLIDDMIEATLEIMKDRKMEEGERKQIAEEVAVGALKYSILRQSIGKDIIFDKEKALSFEGDSGPYLQYAHTRAVSVLKKAEVTQVKPMYEFVDTELCKKLYRFPSVVEQALELKAPQYVVTYLTELAALFNRFYVEQVIVDASVPESAARVGLVDVFEIVMKNGLEVLGIKVPERM